jgi:hypothetical protein
LPAAGIAAKIAAMSEPSIHPDFNEETGTLLLRLRKEDVGLGAEAVTYQGHRFQPKDEVHITVIGSALGETLLATLKGEDRRRRFDSLVTATNWDYQLLDRWHHVVRQGEQAAESIIRMVAVPPLPAFYTALESITGLSIPPRPAHITLYTRGDDSGIGIATWDEFEQLVAGAIDPAVLGKAP